MGRSKPERGTEREREKRQDTRFSFIGSRLLNFLLIGPAS